MYKRRSDMEMETKTTLRKQIKWKPARWWNKYENRNIKDDTCNIDICVHKLFGGLLFFLDECHTLYARASGYIEGRPMCQYTLWFCDSCGKITVKLVSI